MYDNHLCCRLGTDSEDDEGAVEEAGHRGRHGGDRPGRGGYDHGGSGAVPARVHGQPHARDGNYELYYTYIHTRTIYILNLIAANLYIKVIEPVPPLILKYTYIHTYIHAYKHTYIHTYIHYLHVL